jgi:LCP family protein required for cell wall assembly
VRVARQIKIIIMACALSLVLTVGGAASYVYLHLSANIQTAGDLSSLPDRPAPGPTASGPNGGPPVNILLLGSQTRDGQTGQFGDSNSTGSFGGTTGTDISDTSMLLHISGDRKYALVVSIPRDTMVDRPACQTRDGKGTIKAQKWAMFDASMSLGGPLCAAETVEQYFHVRVDHFVRLDFNGFRKIVSYLGGVDICIPAGGVNDPFSHLNLPAGRHLVDGDEALAFVRDRHGIGDGGDLGRIEMQKMFLTSLITKIEGSGTLNDAGKLYQLANTTTSSITTDKALGSVSSLLDLADQVQGLKPHNINFITMPTVQDPKDHDRVDPAPQAQAIWKLIDNDQSLDGASTSAPAPAPATTGSSPAPSPTTTPTPGFSGLPSGDTVAVSNGTSDTGLAGRTVTLLKAKNVTATTAANTRGSHPTTQIYYAPGHQQDANKLAVLFPNAKVAAGPTSGSSLKVVLGDDSANAASTASSSGPGGTASGSQPSGSQPSGTPSSVPSSVNPSDLKDRPADEDICSNLPKPNPDAAKGN